MEGNQITATDPKTHAAVALPVPLAGPFHYRVPEAMREALRVGARVRVPFGKREMTGYCVGFAGSLGLDPARIKDVGGILDDVPLLDERMVELGRQVSEYYACSWAMTLDAMIPGIVRGGSAARTMTIVRPMRQPAELLARAEQLAKRAPRQAEALRILASGPAEIQAAELTRVSGITSAALKKLAEAGDVELVERKAWEDELLSGPVQPATPPTLTTHQTAAMEKVTAALDSHQFKVLLLHGVTGSGKTEIYLRALERCIASGRQAIVLVPELALTPQTIARFRARFERVSVLHSAMRESDRREYWLAVQRGEAHVVIGSRAAIFAPVPRLGLIVVDEEHESSYKHQATPRCHDRDVAVIRARQENALAILGSATPSLESYQNALSGKYELVTLPERIDKRPLPSVELVHMGQETTGRRAPPVLSRRLTLALETALKRGEQAILFINRRGFSTYVICRRCGFVLRCPRCDVSLTLHGKGSEARCHHCGHKSATPDICPGCAAPGLKSSGVGTQRVEDEIARLFGADNVVRMDSDTMEERGSHERALDEFREGKRRILLGTQMVAKGLDFPNVTVVGVVNADTIINMPDFRASERTFQLLSQVAGRAGRGDKGGHVVIQTCSPDHPSIRDASKHDYISFAKRELRERRAHGYPPFTRLARIISESKSAEAARRGCADVVQGVKERGGEKVIVLGPAEAPIARIKDRMRWHALVKAPDSATIHSALRGIERKASGSAEITIDVDPISML